MKQSLILLLAVLLVPLSISFVKAGQQPAIEPQPVSFYQGTLPSFCNQQLSMLVHLPAQRSNFPVPGTNSPVFGFYVPVWMCVR